MLASSNEDHETAENALYRALASGSYIMFIGRMDHRGENGIKWYFREQNFPRDDWRQAPEKLVELMDKVRNRDTFTIDATTLEEAGS